MQETAPVEFVWRPKKTLPFHPNALTFEALDEEGEAVCEAFTCYSVGGGSVVEEGEADVIPLVYKGLWLMKQIQYAVKRTVRDDGVRW